MVENLRTRVARGFGWVVTTTAVARLCQVGAAAITTRLLAPEDFGLLAVVTAATLFVGRLTTFGLDAALVQQREVTDDMLNVAWCYQMGRNIGLGLFVFFAAPWLAWLADKPEATGLLRLASVIFPINALRNIGLVRLRRNMDFRRLSYADVIPVFVYALALILFTLWIRTVWALIYALIAQSVALAVASYFFAPHWPRWNFSWRLARPLFLFGVALLGNTVLQMLREQGVVLVLARVVTLDDLGYYNRASTFSLSLFLQGLTVFWRVAYPAMASLQTRPRQLRDAWRKASWWAFPGGVLVAVGFWLGSELAVRWVLGESWLPIVPLMQILGLYAGMGFVGAPSEVLFQAIGRPGIGTRIQAVGTVALIAVVIPWAQAQGTAGAAWSFVLAAGLTTPLMLISAYRCLGRLASASTT
jgi:O-antigen/teichoic acid export membrane protein